MFYSSKRKCHVIKTPNEIQSFIGNSSKLFSGTFKFTAYFRIVLFYLYWSLISDYFLALKSSGNFRYMSNYVRSCLSM